MTLPLGGAAQWHGRGLDHAVLTDESKDRKSGYEGHSDTDVQTSGCGWLDVPRSGTTGLIGLPAMKE